MAPRKEPEYSASPHNTIDLTPLPSTRFIETETRKYPYRDALGRINLHLVNSSLAEAEMDGAHATTISRLLAWQRHAVRAINSRPVDEKMTLDDLANASDWEVMAEGMQEPPKTVMQSRRLFSAPKRGDEPLFSDDEESLGADRAYMCRMAEEGATRHAAKKQRRANRVVATVAEGSSSQSTSDGEDDIYEVEAILEEDEAGGKGFLIRWAGYGEEADTWEPEWNVAPHLVAEFRKARGINRRHVGDDYLLGRRRFLWCHQCSSHFPSDSFSAQQRRRVPTERVCLVHHYKTEAPPTPSRSTTGALVGAHPGSWTATPPRTTLTATPSHAHRKRTLDDAMVLSPPAPPAPNKAARPVARALSNRQAAIELQTSRFFGFGSL